MITIRMFKNFFTIQTVHAASKIQDARTILNQAAGPTGIQQVPLLDMVGSVMKALLGMVGIVFFIMIVYGAYLWFASAGADEKTKKGRGIIIAAISGLMVVLAAGALTSFVFDRLTAGNVVSPVGSGSGLGESWGGLAGGGIDEGKANEATGCCIDRVGEYNFARRVTTESDCIAKQGDDAYSKDLIGDEKAGEAGTGVRGTDWDFYVGLDAAKCDDVFSCWDEKLGFAWGGMSDSEFQQCLSLYSLDAESLSQVWCLKVNPSPTKSVCSKMGAKACADASGVNYEDDEDLCKLNEAEQNGSNIWCYNSTTVECAEKTVTDCKKDLGEIVAAGKEACEKKINQEVWCLNSGTTPKRCTLMLKTGCVAPLVSKGPGVQGKGACLSAGGEGTVISGSEVGAVSYCLNKKSEGVYSCEICQELAGGELTDAYLNSEGTYEDRGSCDTARNEKEAECVPGIGVKKDYYCVDPDLSVCLPCDCNMPFQCPNKNLEFFSESDCEFYLSASNVTGGYKETDDYCLNNCAVVDNTCRGAVGVNNGLCLQKCAVVSGKCHAILMGTNGG